MATKRIGQERFGFAGWRPAVFRERFGSAEQPEVLRAFGGCEPRSSLEAKRAVAADAAGSEVEVRFESNGATVAASRVGLEGHCETPGYGAGVKGPYRLLIATGCTLVSAVLECKQFGPPMLDDGH